MKRFLNRTCWPALALAAAGATPPAGAQSSVTVYGLVDGGVRLDKGATGGSVRSLGSGLSTSSRLGFLGIEDLGGGLKASFVLESGLALDTGQGNGNPVGVGNGPLSFGRDSHLSLGSDATGYLSLGRQYTPLWAISAGPMNDPFAAAWLGGIFTVYSTPVRAANSLIYSYGYTERTTMLPAPRRGLGAMLMWSLSEVGSPSPSRAGEMLGFNVSYGGGDGTWWAGYGFNRTSGSNGNISATAPVSDAPKLTQQTLAASAQLGPARLHAGYNTGRNDAAGSAKVDRRNWHVGLSYPFAAGQSVRAICGVASDRSINNADFKTFQVGYQYELSKRTALYAAYGMVDNNANAAATPGGAVGTYAKGSQPKSLVTGVRHNF